jgi:hypothetical protein
MNLNERFRWEKLWLGNFLRLPGSQYYKSHINVSQRGKVTTLTCWNSPNQSLNHVIEKKKKNH